MTRREMDLHRPVDAFNRDVCEELQRELLRVVLIQYAAAAEHCHEQFSHETANDELPHYRRAMIEEEVAELIRRTDGHSVKSQKNRARNCSHNVFLLGGQIALTQSKVDAREQLPRDALFRGSYAETPQTLFAFMKEAETTLAVDGQRMLYGILTHCPSEVESMPLFVDIVFPDARYECVVGRVCLLERFPDVVEQFVPEEEVILPQVDQKVRLKRSSTA